MATHDPELITAVLASIEVGELDSSFIRFELLLGVGEDQLKRLQQAGVHTQVYVTYGSEWFLYLCNRLAEHPPSILPALARALVSVGY